MSPSPIAVSESVMERVSTAIDALKLDETLPRTKRELERLSGLSHATVARAFVRDVTQSASHGRGPWRLTERFASMTVETGRQTSHDIRNKSLIDQLKAKNDTIAELKRTVDRQAQALYALYVRDAGKEQGVIPLGGNRPRRRSD